jgi:tetratricopeptide (TPR) repeat protein
MKYSISFTALCLLGTLLGSIPANSAVPLVERSHQSQYRNAIADYYTDNPEFRQLERDSNFNAGMTALGQSNYLQAVIYFTQALSSNPNKSALYTTRGIAFLRQNYYRSAFNDLSMAIQINSSFADPYYYRGAVYLNSGMKSSAAVDFTKAMSIAQSTGDTNIYNRSASLLQACYR